jgi:hypothetical protein
MVRKQNGGRRQNRKTRRNNNVPLLPLERVAKGQYLQRQDAQRRLINSNRRPTVILPQVQKSSPKERGWWTFFLGSRDSPSIRNNERVPHNNLRNGPIGSAFPITNRLNNITLYAPPPPRNTTGTAAKPLHAPPPSWNKTRRNHRVRSILSKNPVALPALPRLPPRGYDAQPLPLPPPPPPPTNPFENMLKPQPPPPRFSLLNTTRKNTVYPPRGYAPRITKNNRPGNNRSAINWEHYYPQGTNPKTYVNTE